MDSYLSLHEADLAWTAPNARQASHRSKN
jgi:hypothetical protein